MRKAGRSKGERAGPFPSETPFSPATASPAPWATDLRSRLRVARQSLELIRCQPELSYSRSTCASESCPIPFYEHHKRMLRFCLLPCHVVSTRRSIPLHKISFWPISGGVAMRARIVVRLWGALYFPFSLSHMASHIRLYYLTLCVNMFIFVNIGDANLCKSPQILDELQAGQSIFTNFRFGPKFVVIYIPYRQHSMICINYLYTLFLMAISGEGIQEDLPSDRWVAIKGTWSLLVISRPLTSGVDPAEFDSLCAPARVK